MHCLRGELDFRRTSNVGHRTPDHAGGEVFVGHGRKALRLLLADRQHEGRMGGDGQPRHLVLLHLGLVLLPCGGVLEEGLHRRVKRQLEPGQAVLRGLARREHDAAYS